MKQPVTKSKARCRQLLRDTLVRLALVLTLLAVLAWGMVEVALVRRSVTLTAVGGDPEAVIEGIIAQTRYSNRAQVENRTRDGALPFVLEVDVTKGRARALRETLRDAGATASVTRETARNAVARSLGDDPWQAVCRRIAVAAAMSFAEITAASMLLCATVFILIWAPQRSPRLPRHSGLIVAIFSALPAAFIAYTLMQFARMGTRVDWLFQGHMWRGMCAITAIGIGDGLLRETLAHTQDQVHDFEAENYVRFARANGYPLFRELWRDILSRSMVLVVSRFVPLMSSAVIVERILGEGDFLKGLGHHVVLATVGDRVAFVLIVLCVFVALVTLLNLGTRILTARLDPRVFAPATTSAAGRAV